MKNQIALCSLALNPMAPSPTANMVRISEGRVEAFGGTFAISVPVEADVDACFNPAAISTFFRKERKGVAYTLKKGRLTIQDKTEKVSLPCLPPEELVMLDILGDAEECELDLTHFRSLTNVINPTNHRLWAQGVSFRYGMAESTDNHTIVSAITNLPDEMEFNLPVDSAKALMKFKSPVTAIAVDENAVKFYFKDGSTLCSRVLTEQMIETACFYGGEWKPLKLKGAEDLFRIPCKSVVFEYGTVSYVDEGARGTIEKSVCPSIAVSVTKELLDHLLRISSDIRVSEDNCKLMAVSDNCRAICATKMHTSK